MHAQFIEVELNIGSRNVHLNCDANARFNSHCQMLTGLFNLTTF